MQFYFTRIGNEKMFRGCPRTTIVTTLNEDIKLLCQKNKQYAEDNNIQKLTTMNDFEKFIKLALERKSWKRLTNEIYFVAKAERSFHWN